MQPNHSGTAVGESTGEPSEAAAYPELVFGLVGPLGADLRRVDKAIEDALAQVNYAATNIRLSGLMGQFRQPPWSELTNGPTDERVPQYIAAGNRLREVLNRHDAVALLAVAAIRRLRRQYAGDPNKPVARRAYVLHSLKRPEEIETLRRIYGPTFYVIAVYSPRQQRVGRLANQIAEDRFSNQTGEFISAAEKLVKQDEKEAGNPFGQNVLDTFALADMIINASDDASIGKSINRFVEIIFGNTFHTPTSDEQGMFLAQAAALRSASLARQVGAAICRTDGSLVALGTNDVAKYGGGLYWAGDSGDGRDYHGFYDTSDRMKENLLADILLRLQSGGWLSSDKADKQIGELVNDCLRSGDRIMKGAQFTSTIDYVRAVHAEMAALTDAARHGVPTKGCVLYTTTFPCHDCAKHIVAAGIERVLYIEPYPKSLVQELYRDSIAVDSGTDCLRTAVRFDPFVGVAPKRYTDLFILAGRDRKNKDGSVAAWTRTDARPKLPEYLPSPVARLTAEEEEVKRFQQLVDAKSLMKSETRG
jgi:deoxycytidylate deaminase